MSAPSQPAGQNQPAFDPPIPVQNPQHDVTKIVVSPAIQRSLQAFRAALPHLLTTKKDSQQWVAFCGEQLITFGRTKTEAYQECLRRGLRRGTFIVRSIEPELPDEIEDWIEA